MRMEAQLAFHGNAWKNGTWSPELGYVAIDQEGRIQTKCAAPMALVAGLALGAGVADVLHAQAKPMSYVIAENIVNDRDAYANDFAPVIAKTVQEANGKFLWKDRWHTWRPTRATRCNRSIEYLGQSAGVGGLSDREVCV